MPDSIDSRSTSVSLLRRVTSFEAEAWQRFARLYTPLVYRWSRKAGLHDSDIDDVTQEVFRTVALGLGRFTAGQPKVGFRAWLWGVTRNKLSDHFRALAKEPRGQGGSNPYLQQLASLARPESDDGFDFDTSIVHRALELLRPEFEAHCWDAFWRTTIGNERASDIAEELGMTKSAVRQAKYRVLRRLRVELEQQIEF